MVMKWHHNFTMAYEWKIYETLKQWIKVDGIEYFQTTDTFPIT